MKKAYIFLAEGFEEMEAVTPLDLLRRVGVDTKFVSVSGEKSVTGSHGITYAADVLFEEADFTDADALILPGGMPGTLNLQKHKGLTELLTDAHGKGSLVCAICAAPMVLGGLGLLQGRTATIYPGMEEHLTGATPSKERVCADGNVVTSRGPATAIPFGLKIVELLLGKETADGLAEDVVYTV